MRYRMEGATVLTLNDADERFAVGQVTWENGVITSVGEMDSDAEPVD